MNSSRESSADARTEEERVLREGLQVNPLSAEAMARIRAAAEGEWRTSVGRPPRWRWWSYAAAASVAALALAGGMLFVGGGMQETHGEVAAHLVRFESPGIAERRAWRQGTPLIEGAVLRSDRRYRADGQALLALEGGGNLRVAPGSEFEVLSRDVVQLERGELYIDIPPGAHARAAFTARTSAGEFRHVGTQFAVAVIQGGGTRLRVREGSVHWRSADDESTVDAGREVVFTNGTKAVERPIGTSSREWDWTATTTPDFEIDNRPLGEFLEWVARESGRKLILADDQARSRIATIRMHGSVHGLTPMQALAAVMAATELRYDLPDGQIRVSFTGEPPPRK